jgi:Rieske Fe-S protein
MTTRRVVLKTIGITGAAGCIGCGGDADGTGGAPKGTGAACANGTDLCFNLADNSELQLDGGIMFFDGPKGKKLFVLRTGETFVALSAICTHAGCVIDWNGVDQFDCGCHGSEFRDDGTVKRGPAAAPLKSFATAVNGDMVTVTLT